MRYLEKFVNKSGSGGMVVGSISLAVAMLVMVINILLRPFGQVFPGAYEVVGLFVGITVSFCLPFTALAKRHVAVNVFTSRFPQRIQDILQGFTSLIEFIFWFVVGWMTYRIITIRWVNEATLDLEMPMLPFRILWFIGLIIFCSILLLDILKAFLGEGKK